MDVQEVIGQLKEKFGDKINAEAIKEHLKGMDLSKFSMSEIVDKIKGAGIIGDLDGDGVKEGFIDELKGKIGGMFGKK